MKKNIGKTDKVIRLIIAAIFVALYMMGIVSGTLGIVLLVLAAVFVITSFVGTCPLYLPFGLNSCKTQQD